jgi:hypothetical protein
MCDNTAMLSLHSILADCLHYMVSEGVQNAVVDTVHALQNTNVYMYDIK